MEPLSVSQLAGLTGKTREFVGRQLAGLPFEQGAKGAKLYPASVAFERIYIGTPRPGSAPGESVSEAESRRRLNDQRLEEIKLNMEIKRKEWIPLAIIEEVNDRIYTAVAAILTRRADIIPPELAADMLEELRRARRIPKEKGSFLAEACHADSTVLSPSS